MLGEYLGEFPIDPNETFLSKISRQQLALHFIFKYGQIDGGHHKAWVLDQVSRILNGAEILNCREAKWADGYKELRFEIGSSRAYEEWVERYKNDDEYDYDEGIAP